MSQAWCILQAMGSGYKALAKDGSTFTDVLDNIKAFPNEEAAKAVAATIKTPTLVQVLVGVTAEPTYRIPTPDSYDFQEFMTIDELIANIHPDVIYQTFEVVEKITGAKQMTSSGLLDPIDGRLIGREFQFSWNAELRDNDRNKIHDIFRQQGRWDYVLYQTKRLGGLAYSVLTLRQGIVKDVR